MLQRYVWNQGNGWQVTIDEIVPVPRTGDLVYDAARGARGGPRVGDDRAELTRRKRWPKRSELTWRPRKCSAGGRASCTQRSRVNQTDAAFAPEPLTGRDLQQTGDAMRQHAERKLELLDAFAAETGRAASGSRDTGAGACRRSPAALRRSTPCDRRRAGAIRCHGDYHLGQILVTEGDIAILDFEGEPARPLARAADQELAAARCGGDASLVRLCRGDRPRGRDDDPPRRPRTGWRLGRRSGRSG